jgi:hypothetical protein
MKIKTLVSYLPTLKMQDLVTANKTIIMGQPQYGTEDLISEVLNREAFAIRDVPIYTLYRSFQVMIRRESVLPISQKKVLIISPE